MAATTGAYAWSVERARALLAQEAGDARVSSDCGSILLEHGRPVARSIVCMHGITSSPVQFRDLGQLFYQRGYNVFIPRLPHHGYANRLTHDHARLRGDDYVEYANAAVDIGRGLGDHLTVVGLSVSGVIAAWCAQTRADLDLAVAIAPAFAPYGVPVRLIRGLVTLMRKLPNSFVSWDFPRPAPVKLPPGCGYPRFSTHALAEAFVLGAEVLRAASAAPPSARAILIVTNPGDQAVNDPATRAVVRQWRTRASDRIREYRFGREVHGLHDVIGPYQPNARVDYVYPILLDLIDSIG